MENKEITGNPGQQGEFIVYHGKNNQIKLEVRLQDENIWLTQQHMADLFQSTKQNISLHIKNIFEEGELDPGATVKKYLTVRQEGKRKVNRELDYYNLDMVISVGYRVRSRVATHFRIWATQCLKEYIIKGFVMDDERLKNPPVGASSVPDYFDELLERIRDIRASERRMYLRVREIFAMAADYEPTLRETTQFFSIIQNKLHYSATGMTAAELIQSRAKAELPNMGLTSWKGQEVRKTDVTIAKNYLNEEEISELNRIVTMWLDFAEDQAKRRKQIFMADWQQKLDEFLLFNERDILPNAGSVSKKTAEEHAQGEYENFARRRREMKEAEGRSDYMKQLEDTARRFPLKK